MQYVVLKALSPHTGPIIEPAVATADNPEPAPVLVEDSFFSGDTDEERVGNIARLIAAGVITPYEAPASVEPPTIEAPSLPRRVARQNEE